MKPIQKDIWVIDKNKFEFDFKNKTIECKLFFNEITFEQVEWMHKHILERQAVDDLQRL